MQCVILAGGLGTRMTRFTATIPKALIPVNGEPFIRHKLRQLSANGIDDVVLAVGYLGDQIESEVTAHRLSGVNVQVVHDGPELLGTAGALRRLSALGCLDHTFMITYGDSYLTCDHAMVVTAFDPSNFNALMTVWQNDVSAEIGNCHVSGNRVREYSKDKASAQFDWIDYGLSILKRSTLDDIVPVGSTEDLKVVFGQIASAGLLQAFRVDERFYEIGSESGLADLLAALDGAAK